MTTELRLDLRARPGDICQGEAFQRQWQHRTTWPLGELLHDKYFINMRAFLESGDQITILRYDGLNPTNMSAFHVLEYAKVLVLNADRSKERVPIAVLEYKLMTDELVPAPAPYRVEPAGKGKAKLMKGEVLIEEYGSKSEAEAAMKQMTLANT